MKTLILVFFFLVVGLNFTQAQSHENHNDSKKDKMGCCSSKEANKEKTVSNEAWNEVCPVLGNKVDSKTPTVEFEGKTYGFCCPGCDKKFSANPEKYYKNLSDDGKTFIKNKN